VIRSDAFIVKRYLRMYNRSEVETLLVGRVRWEVYAHPIFDLDCFKEKIVSRKSR